MPEVTRLCKVRGSAATKVRNGLEEAMAATGFGVALRTLREQRTFSLREAGQLAGVDHAYIHRLESGEKASPTPEMLEKLLKALKPRPRDQDLVRWLATHSDADPHLVQYVLADPSIELEVFTAAAGVRHRGTARPDPATLISRIRKAFAADDED